MLLIGYSGLKKITDDAFLQKEKNLAEQVDITI
jgi:hypothetical protein